MPKEECGRAPRAVAGKAPVAYLLAMTAAQNDRSASTPSVASAHDKILIVDFGSQVTQLIARRVREAGVYSEIVPFHKAEEAFNEMQPKAVILSGGPASVTRRARRARRRSIFEAGVPVLGICYGQMTMGAQLGGDGRRRPSPRIRPRLCRGQGAEPAVRRVWAPGERTRCG